MMSQANKLLKVVVVGTLDSEYDSVIRCLATGSYQPLRPLIVGVDFQLFTHDEFRFQCWLLAQLGAEYEHNSGILSGVYMRSVSIVIYAINSTNAQYLNDLQRRWLPLFRSYYPDRGNVAELFLLTKSEDVINRQIHIDQVRDLNIGNPRAKAILATSGRTGVNLNRLLPVLAALGRAVSRPSKWSLPDCGIVVPYPDEPAHSSDSRPSIVVQPQQAVTMVLPTLPITASNHNDEDRNICKICFERSKNAIFLPCGHFGTCYACAMQIQQTHRVCSFCRAPIQSVHKIHDC